MPTYKYQGSMAKVSMNTASGAVVLKKGVATELSADQVKAMKAHPVFAALLKSGDLSVVKDAAAATDAGEGETQTS
ncbi:hypothetical protein LVY74_02050 [Acinetobacter sp. ME22]|uniref:hypothetical protein n=1 Tax=Acinetobacter sp. ME22 TaxID=2904802 RepID=UPI001EDA13A9|nr:hypothetical protein [Acinetobacter sp. ME22]MCG2572339.1 hypothetical protein [Acinetobacter sp. ME22]